MPRLTTLLTREQMHVCCEDSNGGAVIDPLCGAAVTTVMRPGLMVSGILHVRPRVWVSSTYPNLPGWACIKITIEIKSHVSARDVAFALLCSVHSSVLPDLGWYA